MSRFLVALFAALKTRPISSWTHGISAQMTTFPPEKTCKHSPSHDENHEDVMSMDYLEEGPLLGLLRRRFTSDFIYTFSSNMLLSVNPYKTIPGLLTDMSVADSSTGAGDVVKFPTPHVFTVAARSYTDMLRTQRGQSVLMSGESGAGKTEASKLVVKYLVSSPQVLARSKVAMGYGGKGSEFSSALEQSVVRSVPLLEAFGNAKTINNINSSRFGKYLQIHYSAEGAVLGAATTTFLLEKSRLTQHSPGERNFHVFYRLVNDAVASERSRLKLAPSPSDYKLLQANDDGAISASVSRSARGGAGSSLLSQPALDPDEGTGGLPALIEQLNSIGIAGDELEELFAVIAGILHLGNVEFVDSAGAAAHAKTSGGEATLSKSPESVAALQTVSDLWQIPLPLLTLALTERTMSAGRRKSISSIPLTRQQAIDSRNGLIKAVYERLFHWLVSRVNQATHAPDPTTLPAREPGSYFERAAVAAVAATKLFEPKPPKPPKVKPERESVLLLLLLCGSNKQSWVRDASLLFRL